MPEQAITVELYYDGAWHDIVADDDVFADAPVVIRRGQGDESAAPRPAQITMQLANDDDRYRISNPESPLYGKAGRNTPTRVSVGGSIRGYVEASSWACDQTTDFRQSPPRGRSWVDFEGGGLLQRIGQWTQPLKSPFREFNEQISEAVGYWPAEQAKGSRTLLSTVPGTLPPQSWERNFFGFAFDSQHRPLGSAPLMDVGDGAEVGLNFAGPQDPDSTDGWQLSWAARYEPIGADERTIMYWDTSDGTSYGLYITPSEGKFYIYSSKNGTPVLAYGASYGGYDFTQWTLYNITGSYSGGNTTIRVEWANADNTISDTIATAFSGVPATLKWWSFVGGDGEVPPDSTVGHILGVNVDFLTVDLFSATRLDAWTGYLGELAAVRFGRLCDQLGVPYYVSDNWAESIEMGPQPVATFPELLREIVTTENGLLFDHRPEGRIFFKCRADRYNQVPALELTTADLATPPREVSDDLPIHNIVTVTQRDGAEVTAEDSTGPLGSQPPPDGAGEYRQAVDVNVADPDNMLSDLASWWLRHGTVDLPRFPQVALELSAGSSQLADIESVDIGDVIQISGLRENVIRLYVLGYIETIGTHTRRIVFTCAPDQQFNVEGYDSSTARYDSGGTTLKTARDTDDTALTFQFDNTRSAWSTTAEPYDVMIAGERITVTSMGAVSGSGPYEQAATCTRSVNGVVKSLAAGEPVHIFNVTRYAL